MITYFRCRRIIALAVVFSAWIVDGCKRETAAFVLPPVPRGTRAISIHVGLDSVKPDEYDWWDGRCESCEKDTDEYIRLAQKAKFFAIPLKGANATRQAFDDALDRAAAAVPPGGVLLVTISTHGTYYDAADRTRDELICLYDGPFSDKEVLLHLAKFCPGVRILVVADLCYGGDIIKNLFVKKRASRWEQIRALRSKKLVPPAVRDALPGRTKRRLECVHDDVVARALTVVATVVQLAASTRDGLADDGPDRNHFSLFSGNVIAEVKGSAVEGVDAVFAAAKSATMRASQAKGDDPVQEPTWLPFGTPDSEFETAPPMKTVFVRRDVCTASTLRPTCR